MISPLQRSSKSTFKVILAGPHNAGKTLFIWRWKGSSETFSEKPTVGADFFSKEIDRGSIKYRIHMWDTAGQEAYHSITGPYFRSCAGILLLFDLTDRDSFVNLGYWLQLIRDNTDTVPIVFLLGNKCDLDNICVFPGEISDFCAKNDLKYYQTSAKERINIDLVIDDLLTHMIASQEHNKPIVEAIKLDSSSKNTQKCC